MKKLIVFSLVFALVTGAVLADTYFGAWGRAVFIPVYYNGNVEEKNEEGEWKTHGEVQSMTDVGWAPLPNMAFYFSISGEQIGFVANWDFAASDGPDGQGRDGEIKTWWKPNDKFRMDFGWARDATLRGYDNVDSLHFLSGGMWDMHDLIFQRLSTAEWYHKGGGVEKRPGAIFALTPIDGLYLGAAIATGPGLYSGMKLEDVLKYSQYAIGYTINGIGLIRAGYHGVTGFDAGWPVIPSQLAQFAFQLNAIDGLTLDLGFGYRLNSEDYGDADLNTMQLGLAAGYNAGAFNIDLNFGGFFGGTYDKDAGTGEAGVIRLMLTPAYTMDFGTIGANFILGTDFSGNDNVLDFGAGLWFSKSVGGGSVKAGLALHQPAGLNKDGKAKNMNFAIPIELTYSIW